LPEGKEAKISNDPAGRSSTLTSGTCHGFSENELEGRYAGDGYILREGWVVWRGKGCGGKKNGISTGAADFGRVSTSTTVQANVIVLKK
jgi:hypothetical protein